ncbi:MAG: UbiD family decarboxylase [Peptostreptococcaceae bacterium]
MNFKEVFEKSIDFIDIHRKKIIIASLSILGCIFLGIILVISSDELSVEKEASELLQSIEQRKYSIALDYYNDKKIEFSTTKMSRFNKAISKKINKLLVESGDKYISSEITKEHYIGIINTINALGDIEVDVGRIIEQSKRANEMYEDENISYDIAISYMNTVSTLNGIVNDLDVYTHNIKQLHDSREVYEQGIKNQNNNMYYEAIKEYDKVLQKDEKYYSLAQKNKKQCIEDMYDYYLNKISECDQSGNYEEALKYVKYIKEYYKDDEQILQLEKEYNEKLSIYTLSSEDIINLISKKSGKSQDSLSITSFYQMIDGNKYYYVEVFEYEILVDEILIDAKTKQVYSYKDTDKNYNTVYSDGYFRVLQDGEIQFAISQDKAEFILGTKFENNGVKYKSISKISEDKADKYIQDKQGLDQLLGKNKDLYYYELVNKGLFKKKEVYIINMYTQEVYSLSQEKIKKY